MTEYKLNNGYTIRVISLGQESPMKNHKGMSIASDDDNKTFYVYELMMVTYGTDSVIKACESYPVPSEA